MNLNFAGQYFIQLSKINTTNTSTDRGIFVLSPRINRHICSDNSTYPDVWGILKLLDAVLNDMSSESQRDDTDRVGVRTYVPRYQKETWKADAERLGMSQAEFVRTMVQAGRRSFDFEGESDRTSSSTDEGGSTETTPTVQGLETQLVSLLDAESHRSWDELLAGVTDDVEDRLESTLETLQQENRVHYSGRHGGYTLTTDE